MENLELKTIEIELHNFCNRKCAWCPMSMYDRGDKYIELDQQTFKLNM